MTPTHQEFSDDHTPIACFISYGTWLHGDRRGSVDRFHNRYGTPKLAPNPQRRKYEESLLKRPPVKLTAKQRAATEDAIRDTCKTRKWILWAVNVRTNHAHSVVTADCSSRVVRSALKANATRTIESEGAGTVKIVSGRPAAAEEIFGVRRTCLMPSTMYCTTKASLYLRQ
jgi:REP element-mobilizing transposase RayT